jgi:aminoglycoside phosphotransferase (APT) family kinase protein
VIAERAAFLRERFGLTIHRVEPVGAGWDSDTYEVDGQWIFRFPRRPKVEERVRREIGFLPELAETLRVAVPRFEFVSLDPVLVGYRKLDGTPVAPPGSVALARDSGRFLSELHSFPVARAEALGLGGTEAWRGEREADLADFRERVLPLLGREAAAAAAILDEYVADEASFEFQPAVVHADLGPEHLLSDGRRLTGVIDWSDATIGDPALDFAWLLHANGEAFADALVESYGGNVDDRFRRRALFFHRIGPWHEVVYGLDRQDESFVASGLDGIRARLPT